MAITSTVSADGSQVTIYIQGRFDFSSHQEFRNAYEKLAKTPSRFRVDLQGTSYLDSSALGMLLLLKEKVVAANKTLALVNCRDAVKQVLREFFEARNATF